MSESFYQLPKDERWLDDGSHPGNVGGYDTDLSNLGGALYRRVRDAYPLNEVPPHIAVALSDLQSDLRAAEREVASFIELVSADQLVRRLGQRLDRA